MPAPAPELAGRVREHLGAGPMAPGDAVVVALSGGLDSVALLHLLRFPLQDLGLEVRAAHLDHAMRPGSGADAAWVRGLCRAWDVPLVAERLDPPAPNEADARARRYAFLERVASSWVLTAHHRDDQAETVLFRAIRGTGVRGLRGIAPRRGRVLRPLLPFGRAEIEAYGRAVGLRYREDPTNQDTTFARNHLRHVVLPQLEAVRPGAARALARLAERARGLERAWDGALDALESAVVIEEARGSITLARDGLQSYHRDLRARVLRRVLRRYGSTPDRAGTQAALEFISSGPSGGEFHVAGGVRIERDFERIRVIAERDDHPADIPLELPDAGPGTGRARVGGRVLDVAWGTEENAPKPGSGGASDAGPHRAVVVEPRFPLTVRGWRPGDRIRLAYGTKKLTKLFAEGRLDRRARRRAPLVVDADGRVLWVVGLARAEGVVGEGDGFGITVEDESGQR